MDPGQLYQVKVAQNAAFEEPELMQAALKPHLEFEFSGRDKGAPLAGSPAKPRPAAEATAAGEAGLLSTSARRAEAAEAAKPCLKV